MSTGDVSPVPRKRPSENGDEWDTATGLLDFLRSTVVNKVAGLTDDEAFTTSVLPSTLTPAGVVRHLTGVERFWFSIDFAAADLPWPWTDEDPHGNFGRRVDDNLAAVVTEYLEECQRSRDAIKGAALDDRARGPNMSFTLRYALAHMIEETAHHCGHLDLLRERIDGATGSEGSRGEWTCRHRLTAGEHRPMTGLSCLRRFSGQDAFRSHRRCNCSRGVIAIGTRCRRLGPPAIDHEF